MAGIDRLEVEVEASAAKANAELNKLINRLDKVAGSLQNINASGLTGFARGIEMLGKSMQSVNAVKTTDFTRLVKNIEKISATDSAGLVKTASAMGSVARSLTSTGAAMKSSENIVALAGNLGKLGGKNIEKAIANLPKLASELKNLMSTLSQSPNVSKNVIQMTNALANLSSSLKGVRTRSLTASSGTKSLAKGLFSYSSSAKDATKKTLSLASAFGKFYATYWLLIRGFGQLKKAINISSDLTEVQNVVDVTFGKYRGMLEDFASTSITEFGMSELTSKKMASRFQAMGTAMGFAQGQMADMSIGLTKLAADMASFYNVEQADVAQDLESIFTGQTRPLRAYGIDLTQATLKEWAMKQGLDANVQSMSQAEKTLLRYQYVLANTGAAQGDFARTANTWANQTRILSQQFQALASTIGGVLINVFKPFVTTLNKIMAKVREFAKTVADALGAIFGWTIEISSGGVADDFSDIAGSTEDTAGNLGNAAGNLDDAADAAKKLRNYVLSFDELNILGDNQDDSKKPGSSGGAGGGSGIGGGAGGYGDTSIVSTESVLKKIESDIKTLEELGGYIGRALTNAMNSIDWDSVYAGAKGFGTGLAEFLNGLISPELFGATGRTIAGALNTAIYAALSFGETFDWADFGLSIATGINEFFSTFDFKSLAKTINTWVDGIYTSFKTALGNIKWSEIAGGIAEFLSNLDIGAVGIIIGYLTVKKIMALNIAGAVGTLISRRIAQLIASTLGIEIAKNAGISAALLAAGESMGAILLTGMRAMLGSNSAMLVLSNPIAAITAGLTGVNTAVAALTGITSAVGGIALAVTNFFSMWKNGFSWLNEALMVFGTGLAAVGAIVLGVPALAAAAVAGIVAAVTTIAVVVHDNWEAVCGFCTALWANVSTVWASAVGWFSASVIEPIVGFFQGFFTRVGQIFEGLWIITEAIWVSASGWFNENVTVPITNWFKKLWEDVSGFFGELWSDIQEIWSVVSGWFDENIVAPLSGAFETVCDAIGGFFDGLWSGIKKGVVGAMNSVIAGIESAINWIVDGINDILSGFNKVVSWAAKVAEKDWGGVDLVPRVSLGRISGYASGGYPETGQLFLARENGINEMIGRIGSKSAVANNDQIVQAITNAVAPAVYEAVSAALMTGGMGRNEQPPVVEIEIKADDETLYRAVKKGQMKADRRFHVTAKI